MAPLGMEDILSERNQSIGARSRPVKDRVFKRCPGRSGTGANIVGDGLSFCRTEFQKKRPVGRNGAKGQRKEPTNRRNADGQSLKGEKKPVWLLKRYRWLG